MGLHIFGVTAIAAALLGQLVADAGLQLRGSRLANDGNGARVVALDHV